MKRLTLMVMTVALLAPTGALHAQHRSDRDRHDERSDRFRKDDRHDRRDRHDRYDRRHAERPQWRSWKRGDRFDRRYARDYQILDHRRYRALRPPPRGYHYVRSGNDAVLVGIATGIVAAVIANAIR
jgi:Ni/Co efflux regulator RcnB